MITRFQVYSYFIGQLPKLLRKEFRENALSRKGYNKPITAMDILSRDDPGPSDDEAGERENESEDEH
ncbi:hypothetical protein LZD49_20375 [Dyadobacter sp. CY261]|nr:hypothetical protein [Dyadobacter sp. CY261]